MDFFSGCPELDLIFYVPVLFKQTIKKTSNHVLHISVDTKTDSCLEFTHANFNSLIQTYTIKHSLAKGYILCVSNYAPH